MNDGANHRHKRPRTPYAHDRLNGLVLAYLKVFHAENDNLPTLAIVCAHFRWASVHTAERYMNALELAGAIERVRGMKAWRFTRPKNETGASALQPGESPQLEREP